MKLYHDDAIRKKVAGKMSKYFPALPDGGEHGGVGAHGVRAHPGLADVEETAAEEGRHAEMICQDCQKFYSLVRVVLFAYQSGRTFERG